MLAYLPYLHAIARRRIRPHAFSWVIWSATTGVVFAAQVQAGAGIGAWPTGLSALLTMAVAVLALAGRGERGVTRTDAGFLVSAGAALLLWYWTADPLAAVVILTAVDALGFGPTLRKSWHRPYEEHLGFFGLVAASNVLVLLALERFTLTTALFPVAVGSGCVTLLAVVGWRRSVAPA